MHVFFKKTCINYYLLNVAILEICALFYIIIEKFSLLYNIYASFEKNAFIVVYSHRFTIS